jgi:predicted enzyme related to lactoylglutathione lyase
MSSEKIAGENSHPANIKVPRITGIGGFFFQTKDPKGLKEWYINILGIDIQNFVWQQEAGPTVFEPFSQDTDYFSKDKQWMLNLRVSDLQGMIKVLESKGIAVEQKAEWNTMPEIGAFARVYDPEGNPIELWEPFVEQT